MLVVTPKIEELIIHRATSTDIINAGRGEGLKLLFDDGFEKVKSGVTTIEELLRVAAPPSLLFSNSPKTDDSKKA
jgi:type IV pilus assembly protein PilB